MWVPTIKATSVTQDTAVDSLSAATTTMNSGVSPRLGGVVFWYPGVLVTTFALWETFYLILLGVVLTGRICFWVPVVILLLRRKHSDALWTLLANDWRI